MSDIDRVAEALERKDYRTAAGLLKQLLNESPNDPWVQFYVGRLHEGTGKPQMAEKVYRQLLRGTTIPKVLVQARQGLQRLEEMEKDQHAQAIAQAKADPQNAEPGLLVLEPISAEAKTKAAQNFARIMKLDPYTARLHLPSRGWRAYRTGPIGELKVYSQELLGGGIPNFWASLADIEKIHVFRVSHFQSVSPQPIVVCKDENDRLGALTFQWSEVSQRAEGLLPIFEQIVEYNVSRNEVERKEATQDYALFCDLHLPGRRCILRFCDFSYDFQQGVELAQTQKNVPQAGQVTNRFNWNALLDLFNRNLSQVPVWANFNFFGETAQDYPELLERIKPYIDLFRREPSNWDAAFHLYSCLVFLKNRG